MPRFEDVPQFVKDNHYAVDVGWDQLPLYIQRLQEDSGLDMNVDFQRGHIWTPEQRIAFVEFSLQGGTSGRNIYLNSPTWMRLFAKDMVVVDGKQRLTTALMFMNDEIPAFGYLRSEYTDKPNFTICSFRISVNTLQTRTEVLQWYLMLNTGGTPHTKDEIDKVKKMLAAEKKSKQGS